LFKIFMKKKRSPYIALFCFLKILCFLYIKIRSKKCTDKERRDQKNDAYFTVK